MLEKIAKMAEQLQPSDFENSNVDAAVIIVAINGRMIVVGGGDVVLQAKGIARVIKNCGPVLDMALFAELSEEE